jgi:hypothetical protein
MMEIEYDALHRLGVCLKFPVLVVMTVALLLLRYHRLANCPYRGANTGLEYSRPQISPMSRMFLKSEEMAKSIARRTPLPFLKHILLNLNVCALRFGAHQNIRVRNYNGPL